MANLLLSFRNPCLLYPFGRGDCLTDAWIGEETYEIQPAGASLLPNKPVGAIAIFWPLLHLASILEQISFPSCQPSQERDTVGSEGLSTALKAKVGLPDP